MTTTPSAPRTRPQIITVELAAKQLGASVATVRAMMAGYEAHPMYPGDRPAVPGQLCPRRDPTTGAVGVSAQDVTESLDWIARMHRIQRSQSALTPISTPDALLREVMASQHAVMAQRAEQQHTTTAKTAKKDPNAWLRRAVKQMDKAKERTRFASAVRSFAPARKAPATSTPTTAPVSTARCTISDAASILHVSEAYVRQLLGYGYFTPLTAANGSVSLDAAWVRQYAMDFNRARV